MSPIKVVIAPQIETTRVLAMAGPHEILRATLGPPSQVHRWAAPLLLEGLALWYQQPLSVVLSVATPGDGSLLTQSVSDGLGFGDRTLYYQVRVLEPSRRRARVLGGPGHFGALRRLCQGEQP
jgi:hypothetical protein